MKRSCDSPKPDFAGKYCRGVGEKTRDCGNHSCASMSSKCYLLTVPPIIFIHLKNTLPDRESAKINMCHLFLCNFYTFASFKSNRRILLVMELQIYFS